MIKKIDHIGIAVRNLDETLRMYRNIYGLEATRIETLSDIKVRIAFIELGGVLIELLEPTEPGAGRIGKFLDERGEGFHHMALRVENMDQTLEEFRKKNVPLRDRVPRDGGDDSKIAFVEPAFTQNVLTELIERKREVKGS